MAIVLKAQASANVWIDPGHVQLHAPDGTLFNAGDVYPEDSKPFFLSAEKQAQYLGQPLEGEVTEFDPNASDEDRQDFLQKAAFLDYASEHPEEFAQVQDGDCMHIQIYNQSASCDPNGGCHINRQGGGFPSDLAADYWWTQYPQFITVDHDCDGLCSGTISISRTDADPATMPPDVSMNRNYVPGNWNVYAIVVETSSECEGEPEEPMPTIPVIPALPFGVPTPPAPPRAAPILYGGVVTNVGPTLPGVVDVEPHLDGYIVNISVPCDCPAGPAGADGAKGSDGADGPPGSSGAPGAPGADGRNGVTPMVPIEGYIPAFDPGSNKFKLQRKTIVVPSDGDGNDGADAFFAIYQMLTAIMMGIPFDSEPLKDTGIGFPKTDEGVG